MSFTDVFHRLDWGDLNLQIHEKKSADVQRALRARKRNLQDFMALISPAAEPFLESMAQESFRLTRQRFGKTIQLYIPLYLSNQCHNICTYCGFSLDNHIRRITLSQEQIHREAQAIRMMGFEHVLLLTGEAPGSVGMPYFRKALPLLKGYFAHISMEVQPLDQLDYEELINLGMDAVMIYQETYHQSAYAHYHLRGNKQDFFYRLETADRLGRAGVKKIGLGSLIGLENWRTDLFYTAAHLDYLQRNYWKTRYSISFPRLRPCEGEQQPRSLMNDQQLVQLICAWRLFAPEVELSLSTRESPSFRNHVVNLGITSMSAASSTQPGGYADSKQQALEQFAIDDNRSAAKVAAMIKDNNLEVVWKDHELRAHLA
ncbi:MAG: 2-iminoacetate synthase ThiH [Endozoicomonadaceae bacterium]|nr:2-iminoacetate synthase ThiH [Endozoicomonadaceae bacterium]